MLRLGSCVLGFGIAVAGCDVVFGIDAPLVPDASTTTDAPQVPARRIFVTSRFHTGSLGGLAGADASCQELADLAGLEGTFLAWLSVAGASPADRMTHSAGPYVLTNGLQIASSWEDLVDGSIAWAISAEETGAPVLVVDSICSGGEVWSNVGLGGGHLEPSCDGWTTSQVSTGTVGNFVRTDLGWSHDAQCPRVVCSSRLQFYCVEQ